MATLLSALETQVRRHLNELPVLSDPSAPTVTPQGTTGATTYSYKVVAMHRQGQTAASSAGSTTTGNASLSSTDFNRITWTAVAGATAYRVYRTVGGATTGQIGIVGAVTQFDDTGLTADATTAPSVNTAGGRFWSSEELIDILNKGIHDLWGALIDLNEDHHQTVDTTNVSMAADDDVLTGVPTDVFRVLLIEPLDMTASGAHRWVRFTPKPYNSSAFTNARALASQDPSAGLEIYYSVSQAGAPIGAPTIHVAPAVSTTITLRFVYVPTLAAKTASDSNPIAGQSDNALIAWTVAYARAKEREDRSPDPNWIAIYATEKNGLLVRLAPRQTQEPEVVEDFFGSYLS